MGGCDTVDVDIILRGTIEELVILFKKKLPTSPEILNVDTPVGSRSYPLLYSYPSKHQIGRLDGQGK
jgi:hypothetical protein